MTDPYTDKVEKGFFVPLSMEERTMIRLANVRFAVALLLVSCNGSSFSSSSHETPSSSNQESSSRQNKPSGEADQSATQVDPAAKFLTQFQGTWTSGCEAASIPGESYIQSWEVANLQAVTTFYHYTDAECKTPKDTLRISHAYTVRAEASNADSKNAFEVDMVLEKIENTILDPATLDVYLQLTFYGYSDWEIGIPKNISGRKSFSGSTTPPMDATGKIDYYLFVTRDNYLAVAGRVDAQTPVSGEVKYEYKKQAPK